MKHHQHRELERASINRRQALILTGTPAAAGLLLLNGHAHSAIPTDTITVLYQREGGANAPLRMDPAVQSATQALEDAFIKKGLRVLQPSLQDYQLLDRSADVVVSFDPDAGFSVIFSVYREVRPVPGSDRAMAEVRLQARAFVGPSIVASDEGRGQMGALVTPDNREFAERRALELASRSAAADLADKVVRRLQALTPAQLEAYAQNARPAVVRPVVAAAPPPEPVAAPPAPGPKAAGPAQERPVAPPKAPEAFPPPKRKFALLIGMSDYSGIRQKNSGLAPKDLPRVATDLRGVSDALKSLGFQSDQVKTLTNAQATSSAVRAELTRLGDVMNEDDLIFIVISAYGIPGSKIGMPVLADFSRSSDPNAIGFSDIHELAEKLPAGRVVLIFDTSHPSGTAIAISSAVIGPNGTSAQSGGARSPDLEQMLLRANGNRHIAVLAASRPGELSVDDAQQGGLFIQRLMRALVAARSSQSLEQVFSKVRADVMRESQPVCQRLGNCKVQTPALEFRGKGNLIRI